MDSALLSGLKSFDDVKVLVLGDLMLDRYTWGDAERVSPEAPVVVLRVDQEELRAGGAASVATLLKHLDAQVTVAGIVGDDFSGRSLIRLLDDDRIRHELVQCVADRPTTTKERFLGRAANRHPHQILRVDREVRHPLSAWEADELQKAVIDQLPDHDVLLISDYAKGVCTPELLAGVITAARAISIPVVVDPARVADYTRYAGATLIKPNRQEAGLATGKSIETPADAFEAGRQICLEREIDVALVTLDRDGIAVVGRQRGESVAFVQPARQRDVYDITGAGDMVLAVAGLGAGLGMDLKRLAQLANAAAGLEIERLGVAPVTRRELQAELSRAMDVGKLVGLDEMSALAARYRAAGRTVVFTNGCFDLLHVGHVAYLQEAANLGDVLLVAINSDRSVRRLKGPARPVIAEKDRAAMLAALACVDHVLIFDSDTPHELLRSIRPDVLVKGGTTVQVVGREVVESYGGRVCLTAPIDGVSTTDIVTNIRAPT